MRFHVLGIGSIGTLVSHHLRQTTSSPISLIVRHGRQFPSINRPDASGEAPQTSLVVTRDDNTCTTTGFDIERHHSRTDPLDSPSPTYDNHGITSRARPIPYQSSSPPNSTIDSLIVCLKTPATLPALRALAPRIGPSSVITLIQNGMGIYDSLCSELFPDPRKRPFFILGTTTHGVTSGGRIGEVIHHSKSGEGDVRFGVVPDPRGELDLEKWLYGYNAGSIAITTPPSSPALPLPITPPTTTPLDKLSSTLTALLSLSDLSPTLLPMPHLHHQLLLKLAVNSSINPLTSILGLGSLPNGALLSNPRGYHLVKSISNETSAILTAYAYSIHAPSSPPSELIQLFSPNSILRRTLSVIRQTTNNTSSMASDISLGRPTEITEINGYLVNLAARLNVPSPLNKLMVDMVKYLSIISDSNSHIHSGVHSQYRLPLQRAKASLAAETAMSMAERKMAVEERKMDIQERDLRAREQEIQLRVREQRARKRAGSRNTRDAGEKWYDAMVGRQMEKGVTEEEVMERLKRRKERASKGRRAAEGEPEGEREREVEEDGKGEGEGERRGDGGVQEGQGKGFGEPAGGGSKAEGNV